MKRNSLDALLWLREQRTQKALEKLIARQAALRNAAEALKSASEAVSEKMRIADEREAAGLSFLMGRTLSKHEIDDFRWELGSLDHQVGGLRSKQQEAQEKFEQASAERREANAHYQRLHCRAEKLKDMMRLRERKDRPRKLALSETENDDAQTIRSSLLEVAASRRRS